jgi:hypothetical protein
MAHRIELDLRDIHQLFNSMDPSPFHERDLDADAEEFMLGWAQEFPLHEPVSLRIHLRQPLDGRHPRETVEQAVRHYFAYRADLNRLELRRLMRQGRGSLLIGLAFLVACLLAGSLVGRRDSAFAQVLREGLTIVGWVAMWKPLEIYLYDWWPLARRGRIFDKMSRIRVEVMERAAPAPSAPREAPPPAR